MLTLTVYTCIYSTVMCFEEIILVWLTIVSSLKMDCNAENSCVNGMWQRGLKSVMKPPSRSFATYIFAIQTMQWNRSFIKSQQKKTMPIQHFVIFSEFDQACLTILHHVNWFVNGFENELYFCLHTFCWFNSIKENLI